MKIEVGKKYVDGMGEIRTIIREAENAAFPFADSEGDTFTASGRYSESTSPLDLIREYTEPVSKPSGQYQTITTQVTVVPTGEPIFSEHATNIIMDDEAGGPFIRVEQNHDEKGIIIELKEWPAIRDAIDAMASQWG